MKDAERLRNILRTGTAAGLEAFSAALDAFDERIITCSLEEKPPGRIAAVLFRDRSAAVIEFDGNDRIGIKITEDLVESLERVVALMAEKEREEKD